MSEPGPHGVQRDVPLISIIVPTRNRRELTTRVVEALWAQTFPLSNIEILVMDNRSTDGTAERMTEMAGRSPCKMIFHVMPENRGPARSRNTGARMASGEILAFTDSDCLPAPDWLARAVEPFRDPEVAFVTGSVYYEPGSSSSFFSRSSGEVPGVEHPTYSWTNLVYRKDVFLKMGGSDERVDFSSLGNAAIDCGDTDLAWRTLESGYKNAFVARAVVYTALDTQPPLDWILDLSRMFVVPALVRRHPHLREKLLYLNLFFYPQGFQFLLAVLGAVLGAVVHPLFTALVLPWLHWTLTIGSPSYSVARLPRLAGRVAFLTIRQAVTVLAMLYGSIRFRCLVL